MRPVNASTLDELDKAFAALGRTRVDGLVVAGEPFFDSQREKIVALAGKYGIPTSYAWRENAVPERIRFSGGLLADTMRWTNRGTFQQVMSFFRHRPR